MHKGGQQGSRRKELEGRKEKKQESTKESRILALRFLVAELSSTIFLGRKNKVNLMLVTEIDPLC